MFGSREELFVSLDSIALQCGILSGGMLVRKQGRAERKMELRASRFSALNGSQPHVARPQGKDSMKY